MLESCSMATESDVELNELDLDTTGSRLFGKDEAPSVSKSDEENADSKSDLSPNMDMMKDDVMVDSIIDENLEDDEENHIMDFTLVQAIKKGNLETIISWLATLPYGDAKKEKLNKMEYFDSSRPIHLAAKYNHPAIAKVLLDEGADPNTKNDQGDSALHVACRNSSDEDITEIVKLLIERNCNVDARDLEQRTPLHIAAKNNHVEAVRILLDNDADMQVKDEDNDQPIHLAADYGYHKIIEAFVERNPECVHWKDDSNQTPLHRVCSSTESGTIQAAKYLIDNGADVNIRDEFGYAPLDEASVDQNNSELVKLLIDARAEVNPMDVEETPLQRACYFGCSDTVSLLLKHGAKADPNALEKALSEGYEEIVKQLIETPQWPLLMRQTFTDFESDKETTPFREMIKKMPDVAEEILNKCTVNDPQIKNPDDMSYSVVFNYEFVEDSRDDKEGTNLIDFAKKKKKKQKDEEQNYGCGYKAVTHRQQRRYTTSWGPVGFKKANHPLAIMVKSKRLNLLTHPLVGSLLHHKWKEFGQYGYFLNLLTYCVYLIFLTTFSLIIENPRSQTCLTVSMNTTGMEFDCGISIVRRSFIYISAIIVIILSLCRLVLEGIQLVTQFPGYIFDWINWMEIALYICAIIFVWVFHVDCLCPLTWQWQIGVVAVFLGWIDLIVFISKFPLTGIYVLMFVKILYTFLKMLILSILLVLAFGLTFYLAFAQPEILRSPFSTPGRSLIKTMTMTTGEFEFDSIFRQDPTGESDNAEEIPFPPISYILWTVFIIIMPVLLTNMLVGLAVGDIQAVQDEAALQKLALQVEQVLTVEELLPRKLRRRFTSGYKEVYPNNKISWRKKILFIAWGGDRYDNRASIGKVLHPHEEENEKIRKKTDKLLHEVEDLKNSVREMQQLLKQMVVKEENRENVQPSE